MTFSSGTSHLSTRAMDTHAGPPRTILTGLSQYASHAALINLVRLFHDGQKKKPNGQGEGSRGTDETKGRHEVGRYKW